MLFRTRDLLVRQRTLLMNAMRGHLAEHGVVAPTGAAYLNRLAAAITDEKTGLPEPVRQPARLYLEQIEAFSARVNGLDRQMRKVATEDDFTRKLQTMPGVGPITAMAIETFAPPMTIFRRSRHGSVSCRGNIPPAASIGSARYQRCASATPVGCSSPEQWPFYDMRAA